MLKDIIKTLKINHYIKNIVVYVPLLFSMNLFNIELIIKCLWMFIAFCFVSSAVYIMNDLIDIEQDKKHPTKCNRPIASGRISKIQAILLLFVLLTLSASITISINFLCLLTIVLYFALNMLYSFWLKNVFLIDAACIAFGFILRILSGCFVISVEPSPLIILMTFFLSMFFTFTKRKLELDVVDIKNCRNSIRQFDKTTAQQFILSTAILSIAFYLTYVLDSITIERAGTKYFYLTSIPYTLIIFRLLFLINNANTTDDPIVFLEKDIQTKYLIISYLLVLFIVMVFLKS